ncbi:MAG TPA: RHS repeat-associated core domain-containing protein, partial [Casimicrobiaceae bacterium]|nr:RHS repeat-associated core domain-containing protein [Casimicrobiaceae bacterium]
FTYNNLWSVGAVQITDAVQTWSPVQVLYDADRLLECAGAANTASCTNPTAATIILTRDPSSGLITGTSTTSNGNAVTDARTISSFGEVTEYQAGTTVSNNLMDLQYAPTIGGTLMSRDALGRLTAKRETFPDGTNYYTYLYDPNGRLTDVYANGATQSTHYDYGVNATRSGYTAPGGSKVVPVYDNQDRMTQYGSKVFTYGPNGERRTTTINNATTSYNYDALGNLLAVALPNGPAITYVVDGLNRRIGKQVGGVLTTGFLYDSQSRIVAQLDGQNHLVNQFVYASDEHVPDYFINVTSGTPNVYRILKDQLGSPRVVYSVTNSSLGIVQRMDFDEFGNVTQDTKPGFQPFGFAGGIYDADTKLVRFGVRDYDPSVGVWLSKDPSGFAGGDPNLYAYSGNDPINRTDPSGLDDTVDFAEQCFQEADSWPPQLKWIPLVAGGVLLAAALFKVQCTATCNVQDIGGGNCPDRVTGWGTGPNQNGACKAAKRDANLWVPSGCYKRHCQCDCN